MNQNQSILFVFLAISISFFAATADKLKNILLIGDSISIRYTPFVEKTLTPNIQATRNPGNGHYTPAGYELLAAEIIKSIKTILK